MTPKQEHFARLYVETGNASEAYRQAYNTGSMKPETVTNEAYKLLQYRDISAMVEELKAEARSRHAVTVDDLLAELEQARAAALSAPTPQSSAAVSATMGKAKMLGLIVDRAEMKQEVKAEVQTDTQSEQEKSPLTDEDYQKLREFDQRPDSEITLEEFFKAFGQGDDGAERIKFAIVALQFLRTI